MADKVSVKIEKLGRKKKKEKGLFTNMELAKQFIEA